MSLTFDPISHTYWWGKQKVPGVTKILKPLYGDLRFVKQDLLEYKSELGKAVHKAVELYVLDKLDFSTVFSPVEEYLEQYIKFEAESGFKATHAEVFVYSKLGYAGQVDLVGAFPNGRTATIDVKTTAMISPAVALQLMAYKKGIEDTLGIKVMDRYALRLTPDKYRLHQFKDDQTDLSGFVGFLSAYRWSEANGKTFEDMSHVN
jgi:hypothetical protein